MKAMTLARAAARDIFFIMACERRPDYQRLVGRWPEAAHSHDGRAGLHLSRRKCRWRAQRLRDFARSLSRLSLKRVAVHDANRGFGRVLLAAVTGWIFANTETHRFWL